VEENVTLCLFALMIPSRISTRRSHRRFDNLDPQWYLVRHLLNFMSHNLCFSFVQEEKLVVLLTLCFTVIVDIFPVYTHPLYHGGSVGSWLLTLCLMV
jgi:hypothetical protein